MNSKFMVDYMLHFFTVISIIMMIGVEGYTDADDGCKVSKCSENGPPIRFPFRLENNQPEHCGYPGFELSCDNMNQTVIQLPVDVKAVVMNINYFYQSIEVHDPQNCFPVQFPRLNLSATPFYDEDLYTNIALFNCSPAERQAVTLLPCLSGQGYQVYADNYYFRGTYGLIDELTSCVKISNFSSIPYSFLRDDYSQGNLLQLSWREPNCRFCEEKQRWCKQKSNNATTYELQCLRFPKTGDSSRLTAAGKKRLFTVLGAIILFIALTALYFIFNCLRRKQVDRVKVQRFLKEYKALKPSRYSFHDIKKITDSFKERLGAGAYGTVYKGKLSNEIFVAVKVLESSLESGAEFIKEVGTMATIHHVNVVRLIGFCSDGIKQALIYEFCPNGSLEKFIYSENSENKFLGWEKLQDIALGIARGIEYLHQGCESQILHFDIKPHNILLDNNFNPKITDFGMAKLWPKDQSKVSMTKARGTVGYIAPEVFSRNFGEVSNKSDVFSFGMLLLEMVGGRKNMESTVQTHSRMYFPEIIYNRISRGEEIEGHSEIPKKIAIVGLWCIQWSPLDRPSMKTVVQMLEAKLEMLPIPPNPFASVDCLNKNARNINTEIDVISKKL